MTDRLTATPATPATPAGQAAPAQALLTIENLNAWYDDSHILHGVDVHVNKGELVTFLGRNGAGKSTILKSIVSLLSKKTGSIRISGQEIIHLASNKIARFGMGYCPEERGIYSTLTVAENLALPPRIKDGGFTNEEVFTLFPNLKERLSSGGTKLSGGEQQMLAIARILRSGADFLLLDEPTEGLAPVIVKQIGQAIRLLKQKGYTIILVEQNHRFAARIADRHYVIEGGRVVDEMTNEAVAADAGRLTRYLSV